VRFFNGEIILRCVGFFLFVKNQAKLWNIEHPYFVVDCASSYDLSSPNFIYDHGNRRFEKTWFSPLFEGTLLPKCLTSFCHCLLHPDENIHRKEWACQVTALTQGTYLPQALVPTGRSKTMAPKSQPHVGCAPAIPCSHECKGFWDLSEQVGGQR